MSQKLLTIVVPVYNVEKYITKCLVSLVLDDPELMNQFEVIIINDGTPDRSAELSREYVKRYPETFRQIDKENGNYGSCINRGLAEARGKYIKILDADDWFDNEVFKRYLSLLNQQEDVDLVLTDFATVNPAGEVIARRSFGIEEGAVFDFNRYDEHRAIFDMHSVTYLTQLLGRIGYVQTEGISHTDVEWVFLPMYAVRRCIYYHISLYQYLSGRDGQTMDPKVMSRTIGNHITVSCNIMTFYDGLTDAPSNTAARVDSEIDYLSRVIYKCCLVEQSDKEFDACLLRNYDTALRSSRPQIYAELEKKMVLNGFPLHYVRFWHRFGSRFPLALMRDIVRKIRYSR